MSVVVIGNFDGVHLGHADVVRRAVAEARARKTATVVLTFAQHPKTFFYPGNPVLKLTTDAEKKRLLLALGADTVLFQTFDRAFADTGAGEYLRFLRTQYQCELLVCGENFRLGRGGLCGGAELASLAAEHGIRVLSVSLYRLADGTPVSSTQIRAFLSDGDVERAAQLLGRTVSLSGEVVHGRHIGTSLGLPTANLLPDAQLLLPKSGVYASCCRCGDTLWRSVTNIGSAPTVADNGALTVETHLSGRVRGTEGDDLYGKTVTVGLLSRLRDERKFPSLEQLARQIRIDLAASEDVFCRFHGENMTF